MESKKEILWHEIENAPEQIIDELIDFIGYLKQKLLIKCANETMLLSESSLSKDWLREEEDKAWANL